MACITLFVWFWYNIHNIIHEKKNAASNFQIREMQRMNGIGSIIFACTDMEKKIRFYVGLIWVLAGLALFQIKNVMRIYY